MVLGVKSLLGHAASRWLAPVILCGLFLISADGFAQQDDRFEFVRESDIVYGYRDGLAMTMEIFRPKQPNGLGVVWAVSSSGRSSREQTLRPSFEARIAPLLRAGYVVFAAIHCSPPKYLEVDAIDDIKRAVKFVRYHSRELGVDSERLAIAGSSSGGYIALMVAVQPGQAVPQDEDPVERVSADVQVAGVFFPPTDWLNYGQESMDVGQYFTRRFGFVDPALRFYEEDEFTGIRTLIDDSEEERLRWRESSPINFVSENVPPMILIHGDADENVPFQQSVRFTQELADYGVEHRLIVRNGQGHAYPGWESDAEFLADWFDQHLLITVDNAD